jgi:hypothetical protein
MYADEMTAAETRENLAELDLDDGDRDAFALHLANLLVA